MLAAACLMLAWAAAWAAESAGPLPRNFGQPISWLYRGAQPSHEELRTLSRMGVRTIVSLRSSPGAAEEYFARELGMSYVSIPMRTRVAPSDTDVDRFFKVLDDPDRRPVYVHCKAGKHRTGFMVALYRVLREGIPLEDALTEMKHHKFGSGHLILKSDLLRRVAASRAQP